MERLDFFKKLVYGLAGVAIIKKIPVHPAKKEIILSHPLVAGFQYYDGNKIQETFRVKNILHLVRQPGNPFDKNAIEVLYGSKKLGYIPRKENKLVARLMDQGIEVKARICQVNLQNRDWERVRVEVYFEKLV